MLSRQDVVQHYQQRLSTKLAGNHPAHAWVTHLPPALCRALVLDEDLSTVSATLAQAYTGSAAGKLICHVGVNVSVGEFSEILFEQLPLAGHAPLEAPGLAAWVMPALTLLGELDTQALACVQQWCSLIQWVAPDAHAPTKTLLTSVAIPLLPHCTLLSVKSLRHIPADHVYSGASCYALAENLFHEALHQQLSASLLFGDSVTLGLKVSHFNKVAIPWRNTHWEIDRVMHAAWVYSNLQRLRRLAASSPLLQHSEQMLAQAAWQESNEKLAYLCKQLDLVRQNMTKQNNQLLDEVMA